MSSRSSTPYPWSGGAFSVTLMVTTTQDKKPGLLCLSFPDLCGVPKKTKQNKIRRCNSYTSYLFFSISY